MQPTTCKKIVTEVDTPWWLLQSQCPASVQANGMKGAVCLWWFKFNHSDVGTECKGNRNSYPDTFWEPEIVRVGVVQFSE